MVLIKTEIDNYDVSFLLEAIKQLDESLQKVTSELPYDVYNKNAENIGVCYNRIGRITGRLQRIQSNLQ